MRYGNTTFSKAAANKVSKADFVKAHAHLKDHVGDHDLGDIHDALTKKEESKEEKSKK